MFRVFRNFKIKVEHNIDLNCSKRQKWFILTSFKKHIQKKEKKTRKRWKKIMKETSTYQVYNVSCVFIKNIRNYYLLMEKLILWTK